MKKRIEKVNDVWFGLFFWEKSVFSPYISQRTIFSLCLHLEKRLHFVSEGTTGEETSRDSKPPHIFLGQSSDLADYCNWEREIHMTTVPLKTLTLGTICLERVYLVSVDGGQLSNTACDSILLMYTQYWMYTQYS